MVIRTLTTAAFMAAGLVAASAAEQSTVSVLVEAGTIKYHEQIAAEYMRQHPDVKVQFRSPVSDYTELVRQTLLAAQTKTLPDLGFYGNFTLRTLVERKVAQPLDPLLGSETASAALGYDAAMLRLARFGGQQYGIPFATSLPVIFYNSELVRRAGGSPDALPTSWDDLLALAAKINALGGGIDGLYIRMEDAWNWQGLVFAAGGRMMSDDEKTVAFDGPEGRTATRILARIGSEGKMPQITWSQARQQFAAGRLGILIGSSAIAEGLKANSRGVFEIKTAPYPNLTDVSKLPAGGNTGVILASEPARARAAWDYLKFTTGPEAQTIMAKATGYLPINRIAITTPSLLGDFYASNPQAQAAIGEARYTTAWYAFPGPNGLRVEELITNSLLDVIYQRAEPDEALKKLTDQVTRMLRQ